MRNGLDPNLPTKPKLIVIGLLSRQVGEESEILINLRQDPIVPLSHNMYDLFGGARNKGESEEEALRREAREETGLNVKITGEKAPFVVRVLWPRDDFNMPCDVVCYPCKMLNGELRDRDSKVRNNMFVRTGELLQYDFLITIRHFLDHFGYGVFLAPTKRQVPLHRIIPLNEYQRLPIEHGVLHPVDITKKLIAQGDF